jgi:uncharacterized protein YeaO (DUF488 family)
MEIRVRRIYEPPARDDGVRVLVDRLWPRGVAKSKAGVDHWVKAAAPSDELRRWFGHQPEKWEGFRERYFAELDGNPAAVAELRQALGDGTATLLFAARDERYNNAVALREYLEKRRSTPAADPVAAC